MGEKFPGSFESDFDSFDDLYNEIYSDGSEQNEALREQTKSELVETFGSQQFQYGSHVGTVYDIVEVCPHIKDMLDRGAGADAIASEIVPFAVELQPEEVLEIEEPELDIPAVEIIDANDTKSAEAKSDPDTSSSAEKSQVVSVVADAKSESPSALDSDVVSEKSDTISLTDSVDRADSASSGEQSLDDYGGDVVVAAVTHESLTNDTRSDKQASSRDEKVVAEKPVKEAPKQLEPKAAEAKSNPGVETATIDADANKQDTVDSSTQDIKPDLNTVESIKVTKQHAEIVNDPMESEKPERFVEKLNSKQVAEIQTDSVEALDIPDKNRTQTIEIDDTIREAVPTEIHYAHETEHEDVTQSEYTQAIPEVDETVELYEDEPVAALARDIAASEFVDIDEATETESVEPQDPSLDFEIIHDEEIDHVELEEFHERDETEFEPVELEPEFIKELAEGDDESDDSLAEELLLEVELDPETVDLETETNETIEDLEQLSFADEKLNVDELIELQINADGVDVDPGVELETMHSELAESIDSEELDIEPVPIAQVGHEIVEVLDITLDQEAEYLPEEFHRSLKQFEQNIAILKQATSAEECNDSLEAIRASLVEILDALGCYDSEVTAKYLIERHTLSELHELLIRLQKELTEKNRPKHILTSQLSSDIVQLLGRYVMSSYRKVWAS